MSSVAECEDVVQRRCSLRKDASDILNRRNSHAESCLRRSSAAPKSLSGDIFRDWVMLSSGRLP